MLNVVTMGRQHLSDGVLSVRQNKTGAFVDIPVHPDLQSSLDTLPKSNLALLVTEFDKPFSPADFTNWLHELMIKAGLPSGLSPHGLRKAACRRLAEA